MLDFIMHAFQVVTAQTLNMSARMPALSKQTEKYYNKNIIIIPVCGDHKRV